MFLRVGLQAENNVLDRMRYHFSGFKGVKRTDLSSLQEKTFLGKNHFLTKNLKFLEFSKSLF